MFNSIFKKQFLFFFSITVVSFVILALSLSYTFKSFFENKIYSQLRAQGYVISSIYQKEYLRLIDVNEPIKDFYEISPIAMYELKNCEKYLGITYILLDRDYNYVDSSKEILKSDPPYNIPPNSKFSLGDSITLKGDFYGLLKEEVLTVGYPIVVNGELFGSVFVNSSFPEIQKSVSEITRVMLVTLVVIGGFTFLLIYFLSKSISKPLIELSQIAKDISLGDFEKRISIKSKGEIGQLSESLNTMAENLQIQEVQRRNFIANISHDLRSPLTSIIGFLNAIIDGTIPEEKKDKYLNIILDETERLQKLANDILDINRVALIDLNLTSFNLNEIIRKTVIQFENRITTKNIALKVVFEKEDQFAYADMDKIQRVIYNLLDNAIKFTNQKGKIEIETYVLDKKVYTKIVDNGIGLSKEDQLRVFDRFFKADTSRGYDKKGSGLGLSIIKEFIKSHNETITLESKINEGTEIIFTLQAVL